MSKNQTTHYILRVNETGYWAGYNTITDQIRKAKMYNNIKYIKSDGIAGVKRTKIPITKLEILTVEINILETDILSLEEIHGSH